MLEKILGNRKFDSAIFIDCYDLKFIEDFCIERLYTTGRAIIVHQPYIVNFTIPLEKLNLIGRQIRWIVNNLQESIAQIHSFELIDFVYIEVFDQAKIDLLLPFLKKSAVILTKEQLCSQENNL